MRPNAFPGPWFRGGGPRKVLAWRMVDRAGHWGSDRLRARNEECLKATLDIEADIIFDYWLLEQLFSIEMSLLGVL